jgi:hypothetical protein
MMGANTLELGSGRGGGVRGRRLTATLMLATRSARELPTAKIVRPIMASESPKMKPNVCIGRSVRRETSTVDEAE